MTRTKTYGLLTLLALALAACSNTPVTPPAPAAPAKTSAVAPPAPTPAAKPPAAAAKPAPSSTVATVTLPPHLDPKSPIAAQRSVYFDFDVFTIKSEDTSLLERHGRYLASQPSLFIKVEGNADERGGVEYNLALGQKRAQAVVRALQIYGAKASQMEAVSWGESKPRAAGHDEAAWAQNRRADLQYPAK